MKSKKILIILLEIFNDLTHAIILLLIIGLPIIFFIAAMGGSQKGLTVLVIYFGSIFILLLINFIFEIFCKLLKK